MTRLPVITGFGGINPAGRNSFHHAYKRIVIDAMPEAEQDRTYASLAGLMGVENHQDLTSRDYIKEHTLIRRIELFDPDHIFVQSAGKICAENEGESLTFIMRERHLPKSPPADWEFEYLADGQVRVTAHEQISALFPDTRTSRVGAAGQVPTGFNPGELYQSRNHPRGLQLAVFGASDALRSTGISVERLKEVVAPDQMAVYSSSAMGQLDPDGYGALFQNPMMGKRPSSKNVPLGLSEMPGDFINAYVLGSVGGTGGIIGACATSLYNIRHGMLEIMSGRKRLVIAGNAEAPIVPEVIEGYRTMGALAEDERLMALDGSDTPDHRRACRPFSSNCGFTVAESAVFTVLMDDELALELGARVLGSVGGVFVNADGFKKSIPGPGIGNYLTVGKAMGMARAILGEQGLRERTQMHAHGTGTPQNRVTESHILNELAKAHGIDQWPISAIKAFVGHSMAPAGNDQLAAAMGTWEYGVMPGITTIDHIADDVHHSNLHLPMEHLEIDPKNLEGAFVNSKGFGGNNATGLFLSPSVTEKMLERRHGKKRMAEYRQRNETVATSAADYDASADSGAHPPMYFFGEGVVDGLELDISATGIKIPGFSKPVNTDMTNPFDDMADS